MGLVTGYKLAVWCGECFGVDPEGCFNGKTRIYPYVFTMSDASWMALRELLDHHQNDGCCVPMGRVVEVLDESKTG